MLDIGVQVMIEELLLNLPFKEKRCFFGACWSVCYCLRCSRRQGQSRVFHSRVRDLCEIWYFGLISHILMGFDF